MVDPQFKTILEDETVKPGQYCILKDSNNPTISPEQIDMNDRIFEREGVRPLELKHAGADASQNCVDAGADKSIWIETPASCIPFPVC